MRSWSSAATRLTRPNSCPAGSLQKSRISSYLYSAIAASSRCVWNVVRRYTVRPGDTVESVAASFLEERMATRLKVVAVAAALAVATMSSAALAEYPCAPGFVLYHGICRPIGVHGYSNPVSGAVSGEANGAARGY